MAFGKKRPPKKEPKKTPAPPMEPLGHAEVNALVFLRQYDGPVSADGTPYHHALRSLVERGLAKQIGGRMYEITTKGKSV